MSVVDTDSGGVGVAGIGSDDWMQVYSFLDPRQLCRCALVSRAWRVEACSERLWRPHFNALPHAGTLTLGLPRAPRPSAKQRFLAHVARLRQYERNPTTGFVPPELCRGPSTRAARRQSSAKHTKHANTAGDATKPKFSKRRAGVDGGAAATLSAQFRAVKKRVERRGGDGRTAAGGTASDPYAFSYSSYSLRSRSTSCGAHAGGATGEDGGRASAAPAGEPPAIVRVAKARE